MNYDEWLKLNNPRLQGKLVHDVGRQIWAGAQEQYEEVPVLYVTLPGAGDTSDTRTFIGYDQQAAAMAYLQSGGPGSKMDGEMLYRRRLNGVPFSLKDAALTGYPILTETPETKQRRILGDPVKGVTVQHGTHTRNIHPDHDAIAVARNRHPSLGVKGWGRTFTLEDCTFDSFLVHQAMDTLRAFNQSLSDMHPDKAVFWYHSESLADRCTLVLHERVHGGTVTLAALALGWTVTQYSGTANSRICMPGVTP